MVEAKRGLYRRLILDGAQRVFAERGYDDARMEEIAVASGLSIGTVYSVFSGKAEIFAAVNEEGDAALFQRAREAARDDMDALAVVLAGVEAYVTWFLEHPDFLRMRLRAAPWGSGSEARDREPSRAFRDGLDLLRRSVARCIAEGSFVPGDPDLVARTMIAMQQVQLAWWLESGRPPAEIVAEVIAQVRRSFCSEAHRA